MASLIKVARNALPAHIIPSTSSCIFFDIETSGLAATSEILEISASCGKETFDLYITPENPIDPNASAVNNITMVGNVLHYNSKPVVSVPLAVGMQKFLSFLESFPAPRIILGHNIKRFDCRYINAAFLKVDLLTKFTLVVTGFIDTLPLYQDFKPQLINHKQNTIVKSLLNLTYEEHNALADVLALQKVFYFSAIPDDMLRKHSFTHLAFSDKNKSQKDRRTLMWMKDHPDIRLPLTKLMIDRIIKAGFNYYDIKNAYKQNGKQGIQELFVGPTNVKPRITKDTKIIEGIFQYFVAKKL